MKEIRSLIHDIFNKLTIAQGMMEVIKDSYNGSFVLDEETKKAKVEKAINAIDQAEKIAQEIRSFVKEFEEKNINK